MLHPVRQKETEREDIRQYFKSRGYQTVDLSIENCIAELTGALIIDYARSIGFCGMSSRVNEAGLAAMHEAFGLKMMFAFDLQANEYHTNVVMMILAGRACVIYPEAFMNPVVPQAISHAFPERTLILSEAEKNAFAGNCIALSDTDLFMSSTGFTALRPQSREKLESWGFRIHHTALDEIEKAGGSLRCMVAEIF
jgi:N-dimethylarginine dimethylaminohydrolase